MNKTLCVIIPTYNRSAAIDYWLRSVGNDFDFCGVDIIVYDSSSDDRTELVVKKHLDNGLRRVIYKRYMGIFDGVSIDHKVIAAYHDYADAYDYIWVCRDGLIIDIKNIYPALLSLFNQNYDIITADIPFNDNKNVGNRSYTDCREFCRDHYLHGLTLGYIIFSHNIIRSIIREIPIDKKNYALYQPIAMFQYIACHEFTGASYFGDVYHFNPIQPGNSFWKGNGRALWQWTERWYEIVSLLPDVYNQEKPGIMKLNMPVFNPFSVPDLLIIKKNDAHSIRNLKKYKKYIPYVTDIPLWRIYLVLLLPCWFINIIFNNNLIHSLLRGLYHFFKKRGMKKYLADNHAPLLKIGDGIKQEN